MTVSRRVSTATLVLAAGLPIGSRALAQADAPLSWANAAGGLASTTTNWAPNAMPTGADDLTFNLLANYAVTFSNLVPSARTHVYRQGGVTLSITSPHTVSTGITIGDTNALTGTVTLTTGTLNSTAGVVLGSNAGSIGVLNVNDDDADLIITGAASDLTVGNNGDAALSITGGGLVQVADQFILGSNAGSSPTLTVSGATAVLPVVRSTLSVLGTGVSSKLGQGGDATVTISNGSVVDFAGDVVVSNGSASISSVTISGVGGLLPLPATLDVGGDLLLGQNTNAGAAAGVATMNVNGDGRLVVGGTLAVAGDADGGTATLHMADGGHATASSLAIGLGATLDLDGGLLDIDGGTFSNVNTAAALTFGGAQNPIVTMQNGATANLSTVVTGRSLVVGGGAGANLADFDVRTGADLTISAGGDVIIGDGADDTGSMIINGAGSTMTLGASSDLFVGLNGSARFEAELGGSVTGTRLFVASELNSDGLVLIENPGTTAQFTQVVVGGDLVGSGGAADLVVNAGAGLTLTGAGTACRVWPIGHVDIAQAATMTVSNSMLVNGLFTFHDAGQLNVGGTLTLDAAQVRGHPNFAGGPAGVNGDVLAINNTSIRAVNGDLFLGDGLSATGFSADLTSLIETGPHTITLNDLDEAQVGHVVLAGGTLAGSDTIEILNNGTIDGFGTLSAPEIFFNSGGGVITATGSGITINGKLRNNSGTIDGTVFTFTDGGLQSGWTGAGTINARAVFSSGTEVNALANMTIGDGSATAVTFNVGSELHADTRTVTFLDSNGLGLPSVTDFSGGHVVCSQPLVVNTGRRLSGRGGSVDTPNLTIFGRLSPGELVGEPLGETGEMTINGNLTLGGVNTQTDIEVGGILIPIEFDRVVVNGTATLAGDLNITFINGFVPSQQDRIEIIRATTVVGTFANVHLAGQVPLNTHVVYFPDKVRIEFCYANCDQSTTVPVLTVADFACFLNRYAANDTYANCDNSVGEFPLTVLDFGCFLNSFAAGCQ